MLSCFCNQVQPKVNVTFYELLQAFYYGHVDVKCVPGGLRTHSGIVYPQSGKLIGVLVIWLLALTNMTNVQTVLWYFSGSLLVSYPVPDCYQPTCLTLETEFRRPREQGGCRG